MLTRGGEAGGCCGRLRPTGELEPVGMDAGEDVAEARAKVRQLVAQAPTSRPAEFVNPLEKIEQLLTCPICLDRYK